MKTPKHGVLGFVSFVFVLLIFSGLFCFSVSAKTVNNNNATLYLNSHSVTVNDQQFNAADVVLYNNVLYIPFNYMASQVGATWEKQYVTDLSDPDNPVECYALIFGDYKYAYGKGLPKRPKKNINGAIVKKASVSINDISAFDGEALYFAWPAESSTIPIYELYVPIGKFATFLGMNVMIIPIKRVRFCHRIITKT